MTVTVPPSSGAGTQDRDTWKASEDARMPSPDPVTVTSAVTLLPSALSTSSSHPPVPSETTS